MKNKLITSIFADLFVELSGLAAAISIVLRSVFTGVFFVDPSTTISMLVTSSGRLMAMLLIDFFCSSEAIWGVKGVVLSCWVDKYLRNLEVLFTGLSSDAM